MEKISTSWLIIGFLGQGLFTTRFLIQWLASEKKRDSVVPIAFWWFSLLGGFNLLAYSIYRQDPVIIVGQSMGMVVYARNLMLIARKAKKEARKRNRQSASPAPQPTPADPTFGGNAVRGPHRAQTGRTAPMN